LAAAKGFDALSDIIASECKSAFDLVQEGEGIPAMYKNPSTDYQIPYFHQQTLRSLFRFVNHVMQHNSGGFERLLRNLIDSAPLLSALRLVVEHATVFGSHVWSGAINIMTNFIHNEPTSYAVIAEAGLSRSVLQAVVSCELEPANITDPIRTALPFIPSKKSTDHEALLTRLLKSPDRRGSNGIIPTMEAILCIPLAYGAICLNSTGMGLFQTSDALERFFDIFESPAHVKCMKNDSDKLRTLGGSFDELARHHPVLKEAVMSSIVRMVARVGLLAKFKAWRASLSSKAWQENDDKKTFIAGSPASTVADIGASFAHGPDGGKAAISPDASIVEFKDEAQIIKHFAQLFGIPEIDTLGFPDLENDGLTVSDYLCPVLRFLSSLFENPSSTSYFVECGGAEYVLDYGTLQSIPFEYPDDEFTKVIHMMAELKAHLVIPSLIRRAEEAIDKLEPFWGQLGEKGFFTQLIGTAEGGAPDLSQVGEKGTGIAKQMVVVHVFTDALREVYTGPMYPTRASQQTLPFTQANLADKYAGLVKKLGRLHSACIWEEVLIQKEMPDAAREAALDLRNQRYMPLGTDAGIFGGLIAHAGPSTGPQPPQQETTQGSPAGAQKEASMKNLKTLQFLLGVLPAGIISFHHLLGHGLITKRRMDSYQRQNAVKVGDAVASVLLDQLKLEAPNNAARLQDRFAYLIVVLSSLPQLMFSCKFSPQLLSWHLYAEADETQISISRPLPLLDNCAPII
jgi:E3 ubiquitin-protein ligase HUWE1